MTHLSVTAYVKLGGALITDKAGREAIREETLRRAALEIAGAWEAGCTLIVGHGSGSFGHAAATDEGFGLRDPLSSARGAAAAEDLRGLDPPAAARVAAAARRLNARVVEALVECGLPALGFPGCALARGGAAAGGAGSEAVLLSAGEPVLTALEAGFVPVVYGDVVPAAAGGTICSTEALFVALLEVLPASRVVLATDVDGVLDATGKLVPAVPPDLAGEASVVATGAGEGVRDVTGGMTSKVHAARAMVRACPNAEVVILNGLVAGRIRDGITGADVTGTCFRGADTLVTP